MHCDGVIDGQLLKIIVDLVEIIEILVNMFKWLL